MCVCVCVCLCGCVFVCVCVCACVCFIVTIWSNSLAYLTLIMLVRLVQYLQARQSYELTPKIGLHKVFT